MRLKVILVRYRLKLGVIRLVRDLGYRCLVVLKFDICDEVIWDILFIFFGDIWVFFDICGLSIFLDVFILLLFLFWVLCILVLFIDFLK